MATESYKSTSYTIPGVGTGAIITALLAEYSDKLVARTEQLNSIKSRKYLWLSVYGSIYVCGFLVDAFVMKTRLFGLSAVTAGVIALFPVWIFLYVWETKRIAILNTDIKTLNSQLKRIVDRASTANDHVKMDFAEQFELDIRIDAAEQALRTARRVLH